MKKRIKIESDSKPGYFKLVINSNGKPSSLNTSASSTGKYVTLSGLTIEDLIDIKILLVRLNLERNGIK